MIIVGAGLSGLLAAYMNRDSIVYEKAKEPIQNHNAILRCRTNILSEITGIPFKKVKVQKGIWVNKKSALPAPDLTSQYSLKVSGTISNRSISNIGTVTRYIPPYNFYEQLFEKVKKQIKFDKTADLKWMEPGEPIISTIPMPIAEKMITEKNLFKYHNQPIYTSIYEIRNCDFYATIYYPNLEIPQYRASIDGNRLIVESISKLNSFAHLKEVFASFGFFGIKYDEIDKNKRQEYGKIVAIDEIKRTAFITMLTLEYNIYSLGRFATWRPNLLMEDIIHDIKVINQLIKNPKYNSQKRTGNKI